MIFRVVVFGLALVGGCRFPTVVQRSPDPAEERRINQVQVLGTHNSYHLRPEPALLEALRRYDRSIADGMEYTHAPLQTQLEEYGVRQLEFDVFADPQGGLFRERKVLSLIGKDPDSGLTELLQPGLKVLHVHDVDFGTRCLTLVSCLLQVKAWSDGRRNHELVTILIEAKDERTPDPMELGFATPLPVDGAMLDAIDAEILSVFTRDQLITPDTIRGSAATLAAGVRTHGWPTVSAARGKFLFVLDGTGSAAQLYQRDHPSLRGRVMFTDSKPDQDEAAFMVRNDPLEPSAAEEIRVLVGQGFLVRTRADAGTVEARAGDVRRRDAAIASGAQFISTDYPVADPDFGTGYSVHLP